MKRYSSKIIYNYRDSVATRSRIDLPGHVKKRFKLFPSNTPSKINIKSKTFLRRTGTH